MRYEASYICYGPVKVGTEGGATVVVAEDYHRTHGPVKMTLDNGLEVEVDVRAHDGYSAKGEVINFGEFELLKNQEKKLTVGTSTIVVRHEYKGK